MSNSKREKIIEQLKQVKDPELDLDICTLELVYEVEPKENGEVYIQMTYTTPMCPYGPELNAGVKEKLGEIGYEEEDIDLEITFQPRWEPSDELREALGI